MYAINTADTKDTTDTPKALFTGAGAPPPARTDAEAAPSALHGHRHRKAAGAPDVAVIGAGPAGSWAAYNLARRGARVTIFDSSHPREKPCGGGVTSRALALVADALGGSSLPASTIRRARFVDTAAGQSAVVPLIHLWDPPSASARATRYGETSPKPGEGGKPDPTCVAEGSLMGEEMAGCESSGTRARSPSRRRRQRRQSCDRRARVCLA
jgi:hypothetical protein